MSNGNHRDDLVELAKLAGFAVLFAVPLVAGALLIRGCR